MHDLAVLILAAGKGERMRGRRPKVLHPLSGRPLLSYSLEVAKALRPKRLMVLVGHQADEVRRSFREEKGIAWAVQGQRLGTAHAVLCGLEALRGFRGSLLILYADVPLLRLETLQRMRDLFLWEEAAIVVLTARMQDPTGYGRIVRDASGGIRRIVEEREAKEEEKEIAEVNSGIFLVRAEELRERLRNVQKSLVKGEYYLTDLVEMLADAGKKVLTVTVEDPTEILGINSQAELAEVDRILQGRIRKRWMERGVTLVDPETIRIEGDVEIEPDAIIHPGVILTGRTRIRCGAEIFPYSVVEESVIGEGARVGPFTHLRPGSVVERGAHVGNFVELKKTRLGPGAKANHLTYLGDAIVGRGVNVGAGTITCNYDGFEKHKTVIGEGAFIGSDTQFVAPVRIGKKAWVGAGTTVTRNVPPGALAISRAEQKNILGWVKGKRNESKRALTGSDSLRPVKRSLR